MKIVWTLLTVLVALMALTFWTLIHARGMERHFATIHPGDDRAKVLGAMGAPKQEQGCEGSPKASAECRVQLVFAHPFAPVVPEYWLVRLGADGRVVQTVQSTVRSSY